MPSTRGCCGLAGPAWLGPAESSRQPHQELVAMRVDGMKMCTNLTLPADSRHMHGGARLQLEWVPRAMLRWHRFSPTAQSRAGCKHYSKGTCHARKAQQHTQSAD